MRAARSTASSVLVGQLDLPGHVVAQVQRLGDAPEAVGVFVDSRYGQQLVDAADGEHQPVVAAVAPASLGIDPAQTPCVEVDAVGLAEDQASAGQGLGQRDSHSARVDHPGGDLGQ